MNMIILDKAYYYLLLGVLIWFGVLIGFMLIRSIMGPRVTDRILSINMIGTMVICCIAILSRLLKESYLVDVALIYAMISLVTVLILAGVYISVKQKRGKFARDAIREMKEEGIYRFADETGRTAGTGKQAPSPKAPDAESINAEMKGRPAENAEMKGTPDVHPGKVAEGGDAL